MPDIDEETTEDLKLINDMNLKSLTDDFAKALSQHVGGKFEITLRKFEQIRSGIGDHYEIVLTVKDDSAMMRIRQHSHGGFFD